MSSAFRRNSIRSEVATKRIKVLATGRTSTLVTRGTENISNRMRTLREQTPRFYFISLILFENIAIN